MIRRGTLLIPFISLVVSLSVSAPSAANPVLIKLSLKESKDWSAARSLGVVAYHRFEGSVLAEFEKTRLGELDQAGLKYQVVDESPWSEGYFLVSAPEILAKPVPVFFGRVLFEDQSRQLIKGSKEEAAGLARAGYMIVPIRRRALPLDYQPVLVSPPFAARYSQDIGDLVDLVSADSLHDWIQRLQDFHTRYSYSDSIIAARDWLYQKMSSFGIDSLWLHHYYWDSHQWNVVATVEGTVQPDRVIVVGGHYDSVVYGSGADPMVFAPGADDNASGTVVALELARILSQNPLPITVMLVPFAQEEQGLVGSDHFAEYLHNRGTHVEMMINSDMAAHSVDSDPDVLLYSAPEVMPFVKAMKDAAGTYTSLRPVYDGQDFSSDQNPFYQFGYNAVATSEGEFHTAGWHTNYDLIDSLNFPYLGEVVKMCLATVATLANSPSAVAGLTSVDAGDGDAIYLSWTENSPVEDVDHYKLYFGTSSGSYDSVRQLAGNADTLAGLAENTIYFITVAAVNQNGFESIANPEVSMSPRVVPRAPTGLATNPYGTYKIKLDWAPNREADFDHYRVFRSEQSGSGYQLLEDRSSDTSFVDSTVEGEVEYYYYTLTAVDTSGNESQMSTETPGFAVTLDQGLLVVDETYIDVGNNMVNGDSINVFYQRALEGYTYAYIDHSCPSTCFPQNQLRLPELGRYSVAIVHSEDFRGNRSLGADGDSTFLVLKKYLDYGGKIIIEGRRNLSQGDDGDWSPKHFSVGDVRYDRLHVESALVPPWSIFDERSEEFVGAHSQVSGYPDLQVDSLRVAQAAPDLELLGRVPGVGYIDSLMAGEVIYTFHSTYDTSASQGKPVAFRYLGAGQQVIFFDFPLYFIEEQEAGAVLHQALGDLGMFPSSVEEASEGKITSFHLEHNFPNPFNAETIIEYSLPRAERVRLTVYNILGQTVRVLVDEMQTSGSKRVIWNGRDQSGQDVASGIYFYRMEAGEFTKTNKMLLLK